MQTGCRSATRRATAWCWGRRSCAAALGMLLSAYAGFAQGQSDDLEGRSLDDLPVLTLPGSQGAGPGEAPGSGRSPNGSAAPDGDTGALGQPLTPRERLRQTFLERMKGHYGPAISGRAAQGLIPDGEVLFLDLELKRLLLATGLLGVKAGRSVLFNLTEFVEAVDFAIEVDETKGLARGWFRTPNARFSLDFEARRAVVRGQTVSWPVGQVLLGADGMLVHADLLEAWFGLEINVDLLRQKARLSSVSRLPIEDHLTRVRRFERLSDATGSTAPLPPVDAPPSAVAPPNLDVQAVGGYRQAAGGAGAFGRASIQGGGDLLYASSTVFVAGNNQDGLTNARLRLERDDLRVVAPRQPLSGIAVGDVRTARLPVLGGNVEERGVVITNLSGEQGAAIGVTEIIGDVTVGWDVELYRNAILIGFEGQNPDGRYEFREVQLFPGQNVFRLVFYGPQGQVEEETRVIPLSSGAGVGGLPAFTASFTQQGRTLIDLSQTAPAPETGRLRAAIDLSVPLPAAGFVQLGYLSLRNEAERQHYLVARGTRFLGPVLLDASAGLSDDLGSSVEMLVGGSVKGQQIRGTVGLLQDFSPPARTETLDRIDLGLSMNGQLPVLVRQGLNYALQSDWQAAPNARRLANTISLGSQIGRFGWGADVQHLRLDDLDQDQRRTTWGGAAQGNVLFGRSVLRGTADFVLSPDIRPITANATLALREWDNVTASVQVARNFAADVTSVDARADWRLGRGFFGPRVAYDTSDNLEISLQSRLSLGLSTDELVLSNTPLAGRGMVQANVFVDLNRDGIANEGEIRLADVTVEAVRERRTAATDKGGRAVLIGLPAGRRIDIRIADKTLAESFLKPAVPGYSVRLRRGQTVTVDLPVVQTGEIEGQVFQKEPEGIRPVQRTTIVRLLSDTGRVLDAEPVALDGFFVMSDVAPGDYVLSVDPVSGPFAGAWQRVTVAPERVTVVDDVQLEAARTLAPGQPALSVDLGSFRSEFGAWAQWRLLRAAFPEETRHLRRVRAGSAGRISLTLASLGGAGRLLSLCARLKDRAGACEPRLLTL
ncbi:MAG: hypothetical protein ACFB6R_13580 [Alphaproteobacteria bacterium]